MKTYKFKYGYEIDDRGGYFEVFCRFPGDEDMPDYVGRAKSLDEAETLALSNFYGRA